MAKVNPYYFYSLGDRIGRFRKVWTVGATWAWVATEAEALLSAVHEISEKPWVPEGLEEAQRAIGSVLKQFERIQHKYGTRPETIHSEIETDDLVLLKLLIDRFEHLLHSDLERMVIWYAPEQHGYGSASLMATPWNLFGELAPDIRALAERDLQEFGRSFLFDSGTAAGFHLLRACELVMREYCKACGKTPPAKDWGGLIAQLSNMRDLPKGMTKKLEALREYDRNEIMHPIGRFLTIDDVGELLDKVKLTMKEMLRDIRARRATAKARQ